MSRYSLLFYLFAITTCFVNFTVAKEAIIGGEKAEEHQFPYQVSLFYNVKRNVCGGAIIGVKHILTAAHCVIQRNGEFFHQGIIVRAGTSDRLKTNEPSVTIDVERIFVPTEFDYFVNSYDGDIAVLELTESLELSKNQAHMRKLKLPKNQQETYDSKTTKIAGFGWNWIKFENNSYHGNNTDGQLRFSEAYVLDNSQCQQLFPVEVITGKLLCARVKQSDNERHGVCNGDSGGPLVVDDSIVIGILSKSPNDCSEIRRPAIYTRVSRYLTFIANALKGRTNKNIRVHQVTRR